MRDIIGQEFEGDKPTELHILGLAHHTHSTTAQLLYDAGARDGLADHWRESYELKWDKSMKVEQLIPALNGLLA